MNVILIYYERIYWYVTKNIENNSLNFLKKPSLKIQKNLRNMQTKTSYLNYLSVF